MNNSINLSAVNLSIAEQEKKVSELVNNAVDVFNKTADKSAGAVKADLDNVTSAVKKALSDLNKLYARRYYLSNTLFDIVKGGKTVPSVSYEFKSNEAGVYSSEKKEEPVYPTLPGMNSAGVLPEGLYDKIDLLRREVAYLESGKSAKVYLTGDVANKKDVPSKAVAELIKSEGAVSVNKVKSTLQVVLHDLTGGEYKKEVFSKLYKDFARFIVKRGNEWAERNMVGKSTAGDMVLEYAYMYFNDMREVKYTLG